MNTVKRWLAGFLSFAMIFTSSAFANVGMVYAAKVDPANTDKAVKLTIGETTTYWDAFDNTLMDEINSEENFKKTVTVDLLKDDVESAESELKRPLVINFNGNSFTNHITSDVTKICAGALYSGNAQTGIKYAVHSPETRYVWSYNDEYGTTEDEYGFLWYISGTEGVCANCYGKAGAEFKELTAGVSEGEKRTFKRYYRDDTKTVGYEIFNYTLGQYEFWSDGKLVATQKTDGYTVTEGPRFITDGTLIRHNAAGEPIVDVTVLKNLDGSVLENPTIELTKATYIEEVYNTTSALKPNGTKKVPAYTRADLKAPTCSETGKTLYKVIVKDPEGVELAHCFIVDEQAPTAKHEAGELAKIQILARVGVGYTEDDAVADALSKKNGEIQLYKQKDIEKVTHGRYDDDPGYYNAKHQFQANEHYGEPVKSGGRILYFAWAWVDIDDSAASLEEMPLTATWASAMAYVMDDEGDDWSITIADDGSFEYRPVYYCKYKCDEGDESFRLINGQSATVDPQANETISAKNESNVPEQDTFYKKNGYFQYSTCVKWNYKPFTLTKDEYKDGKLAKTSTNTYKPVSVDKPEISWSHDLKNATVKVVISQPNCRDLGEGTFTCPICTTPDVPYTFEDPNAKDTYGKYPASTKPSQEEINDEFIEIHNISDLSDGNETTVTVYPTCEEAGGVYKWCVGPADEKYAETDFADFDEKTYVKKDYVFTLEDVIDNTQDTPEAKSFNVYVDEDLKERNIAIKYGNGERTTDSYNVGEVITIYPFQSNSNKWLGVPVILVEEVTEAQKESMIGKNKGEVDTYYGHWVLQGEPTPATGHKLSTEVVVSDDCWGGWTADGSWFDVDGYDVAATAADYIFVASQKCLNSTDAQHSLTVYYHSIAGTDTETDKYSAVKIKKEDSGSNCITNAKTTWTVKGLTVAGTNGTPVTKTVEKQGSAGSHKIKVNKFVWSSNLESAVVTGTCEVCTKQASDFATITKKTDANGLTTFTATYGEYTDTRTGYSLNGAIVTFDKSLIKDGNRVVPEEGVSQEVPDVTVSFKNSDGTTTVLDPKLYEVDWDYDHQTKTAFAFVDWTDNIKGQPGYIYTGYAYGFAQVDAGMMINAKWKYDLNGVEKNFENDNRIVTEPYDPANTYKLLPVIIPDDAAVKYAVIDEPVTDGKDKQERIEALTFDKDEVVIHNAGKYYVYAQITKDGYTTYTAYAATFIIKRPEIVVQIDDLTITVGEDAESKLVKRAYEYNSTTGKPGKAIEVDWAEDFKITTVGGKDLKDLDAGVYKLNVQAPNYSVTTTNETYIGTLTVNPKDDATVAAEKVAEQLKNAKTDAELAAAYKAYAALTEDQQKIVKADNAAAALIDKAKAASDAADKAAADKKALDEATAAANTALNAANAYASDANIKALIDALNAAIAKGDATAIKNATAALNSAVDAKKKAEPQPASVKLSKTKYTIKRGKSAKIKYSKTTDSSVTFKKKSGKSFITVSKGKIKVKNNKAAKKGKGKTYKVKITVSTKATAKYKAFKKTMTVKVKVK